MIDNIVQINLSGFTFFSCAFLEDYIVHVQNDYSISLNHRFEILQQIFFNCEPNFVSNVTRIGQFELTKRGFDSISIHFQFVIWKEDLHNNRLFFTVRFEKTKLVQLIYWNESATLNSIVMRSHSLGRAITWRIQ